MDNGKLELYDKMESHPGIETISEIKARLFNKPISEGIQKSKEC